MLLDYAQALSFPVFIEIHTKSKMCAIEKESNWNTKLIYWRWKLVSIVHSHLLSDCDPQIWIEFIIRGTFAVPLFSICSWVDSAYTNQPLEGIYHINWQFFIFVTMTFRFLKKYFKNPAPPTLKIIKMTNEIEDGGRDGYTNQNEKTVLYNSNADGRVRLLYVSPVACE